MYLGWDVGIKNLSFCLLTYNEDTKLFKIIDWGIINLVKTHLLPNLKCCEIIKSTGKQCEKNAVIVNKNNELICYCKTHSKKFKSDETFKEFDNKIKCCEENCNKDASRYDCDKYYCLKHLPKDRKIYAEKISLKATKIPLIQLGKILYEKLDKYKDFDNSYYIIIENQPVLKNPTMKSIQMMLFSYFLKKNIVDCKERKLKDIVLMSAKNKLKIYDGPEFPKINNIKSKYARHKKLAIEHCRYILEKNNEDEKWKTLFEESNKKDDLSDSYLMTMYFVMKQFKLIK